VTDAELQTLVQEVLRRLAGAPPTAPERSSVLVVVTGAEHPERALQFLRLAAERFYVNALPAPCFFDRYAPSLLGDVIPAPQIHAAPNLPQREALVDASAAVVLLLPMRSTIAKIARGSADSTPSILLTRALMVGKPCFTAGGELDPAQWPAAMRPPMRHGKGSLAELVARDLEVLESWGMTYRRDPLELLAPISGALTNPTAPSLPAESPAARSATSTTRQFLTADDVRRVHAEGGRELSVAAGTIVTDAARDAAASLHVELRTLPA
jgi:hypothetical protein